jgi:16S rRNA (guanine966-N2)-methyltransferase
VTLRIIAGQWRGRPLSAPEGQATRPTAARAREALFSMLASRLGVFDGLAVLDLFAGSGALGLEALSRGAAAAAFIERDAAALRALRANIARLGAAAVTEVLPRDAANPGPAPRRYDLAFLDPPYGQGLAAAALPRLDKGGWLAPGAWLAVETAADEPPPPPPAFTLDAERRHGAARLTLLRRV